MKYRICNDDAKFFDQNFNPNNLAVIEAKLLYYASAELLELWDSCSQQLSVSCNVKVQAYILATLTDLLVNMCNKLMPTSSAFR